MRTCPRCGRPTDGECLGCAGGKTLVLGSPSPQRTAVLGSPAQASEPRPVDPPEAPDDQPDDATTVARPRPALPRPVPRHRRGRLAERLAVGAKLSTTIRRAVAQAALRRPDDPPSKPRAEGWRWLIAIVLTATVIGGGVTVLVMATSRSVEAQVTLGEHAEQRATLRCPRCEDRLAVRAGTHTASFASGTAQLRITPELPPGSHTLAFEVGTESREVPTTVCARFTPDLAPLGQPRPELGLIVEALPGSGVVLDGRAVSLDAAGRGTTRLNVLPSVTGPSSQVTRVERLLPFLITSPSCPEQRGVVALRADVAKLEVHAPGATLIVAEDSFTLAGIVQPGATVAVEGRPIAVDAAGRFVQRMTISAPGERVITVRADLPGLAPRLVQRRIERVTDAWARALAATERATSSYDELAAAKPGSAMAAALRGVVNRRETPDAWSTVLWLESVECGVPPCSARIVYAGRSSVQVGSEILAVGTLAPSNRTPEGEPLVQVDATLVAKAPTETRPQ